MPGKIKPGGAVDKYFKAGGEGGGPLIASLWLAKATNTPLQPLSMKNGKLLINSLNKNSSIKKTTVGSTTPTTPLGANKSASNRSRGMQNNVGMQEAQAGNVGSVNTNMINAELQNDDLLGIYNKGT